MVSVEWEASSTYARITPQASRKFSSSCGRKREPSVSRSTPWPGRHEPHSLAQRPSEYSGVGKRSGSMCALPSAERESITDVEGYLLRTPSGAEVPLTSVASLNSGTSPPAIQRRDGQRVVTVTADVDPAVISGGEANAILVNSILADLTAANPNLTYMLGGRTTAAGRVPRCA